MDPQTHVESAATAVNRFLETLLAECHTKRAGSVPYHDGMTVQCADLQIDALSICPCSAPQTRADSMKRKVLVYARWTSGSRTRWMYTVSRWGNSVARWSTNWRADYLSNALMSHPTRWIDHRRAGSPRNITCSFLCALNTRQNALEVEIFWQVKRKRVSTNKLITRTADNVARWCTNWRATRWRRTQRVCKTLCSFLCALNATALFRPYLV